MSLTIRKPWLKAELAHLQANPQAAMIDGTLLRLRDHPIVYTALVSKIAGSALARCAEVGAGQADMIRVLRKYVVAADLGTLPAAVAEALPPALGPHKYVSFKQGYAWRDIEIDSWAALADLVVYELTSEVNYLTEIELAEMVMLSTRVEQSVDGAIERLSQCLSVPTLLLSGLTNMQIEALGADRSARLMQAARTAGGRVRDAYFEDEFRQHNKQYRPYMSELGGHSLQALSWPQDEVQLNLEKKIGLMHDLFQVAYDFFGNAEINDLVNNPLETAMRTQTGRNFFGKVMESRDNPGSSERSKAYAKSIGRPSESGPSYTTVRVCRINELMAAFKRLLGHFRSVLQDAPASPGNPAANAKASARALQISTGLVACTDSERKDLVWAMFAYWTLYYQKSMGPAHTFFEVREAAKQCGVVLTKHARYPTTQKMLVKMDLQGYAQTLSTRLRKRAHKLGQGVGRVKDIGELVLVTQQFPTFASGTPVSDILLAYRELNAQRAQLQALAGGAGVTRAAVDPYLPLINNALGAAAAQPALPDQE